MRRSLTTRLGAVCLALSLSIGVASAVEPRPTLRVVLAVSGEAPPWFDGFVKHLKSELRLRGIDVVLGGSAHDAELVVEVPSPQRPLLRFLSPDREAKSIRDPSAPVRSIALGRVPTDGHALALAVAADELMRSNWPRARVSIVADASDGDAAAVAKDAATAKDATTTKDATTAKDASARAAQGSSDNPNTVGAETTPPTLATTVNTDASAPSRDVASKANASQVGSCVALRVAAAAEIFTGGQAEVGPDVRFALCATSQIELELRGGFRTLVARDTAAGSVAGTALVGGGAVYWIFARSARAAVGLVGRLDLLRTSYTGTPHDAAISGGSDASAFGAVLAGGGSARFTLTRWLSAHGELLAGGSPKSTTATADFAPTVSTSGLAVLASAGLSVGF